MKSKTEKSLVTVVAKKEAAWKIQAYARGRKIHSDVNLRANAKDQWGETLAELCERKGLKLADCGLLTLEGPADQIEEVLAEAGF